MGVVLHELTLSRVMNLFSYSNICVMLIEVKHVIGLRFDLSHDRSHMSYIIVYVWMGA